MSKVMFGFFKSPKLMGPDKRKYNYFGYLYLLPAFLFFATFIIYPMFFVFQTSFYKWDGFSTAKDFIGLQNFMTLYQKGYLTTATINFLLFFVFTVLIQMLLGIIFANMLRVRTIFRAVVKSVIFIPVILTPVVIGYIFSSMLEPNIGFVNSSLRMLGLSFLTQSWLGDPKIALGTIIVINIWQWTGFSMVLYISGIVTIPDEVFDAASIDGAGSVTRFIKITIPMLKSSHSTLMILGAIGALKVFDIVWVLTAGGPGIATATYSILIFKESFLSYNQGTSSALSVILIFFAMIITAIQLHVYKEKD